MSGKIGRGRKLYTTSTGFDGSPNIKSPDLKNPIKIGRGKFLVAPTEKISVKEEADNKPIVDDQFEENATKIGNSLSHVSRCQDDKSDDPDNTNEDVTLVDSDSASKSSSSEFASFLTQENDIFSENEKAEKDWKIFQCERKITKILKDVTDDNLNDVLNEIECLVEDRPLSSVYKNCSEVKQLLHVLIQKTCEKEEFEPFGPCFLKRIADHSMVEFKMYFPEIAEKKKEVYVTLCASDNLLSTSGQRFCKMFGNLFSMPRQTNNNFFDLICLFVEECMEKWTFPDGFGDVSGISEDLAMVYGFAVKHLLLEISEKMVSCDSLLQKKMEKYSWYVYETILNTKLSRKIREVYINTYVQLQTSSSQQATTTDIETSEYETEYDDVSVESEEVVIESEEVVIESEEVDVESEEVENDKCKEIPSQNNIEETFNNVEFEIEAEHENETTAEVPCDIREDIGYLNDPYICIKYLLHITESKELLQLFIENNLKDTLLLQPNIKVLLTNAGLAPFFAFQFCMKFNKTGFEKTQQLAVDYAKSLSCNTAVTAVNETGDIGKINHNVEKSHPRMAMSFVKKVDESELNKTLTNRTISHDGEESESDSLEQPMQKDVEDNKDMQSQEMETDNAMELLDENSDDSGSDIIIEDEYSDTEQPSLYVVPKNLDIIDSKESDSRLSNSTSVNTSSFMAQLTIGRGRGIISMPTSNTKNKPVANVQPMLGEQKGWRKPKQIWNNNSPKSFCGQNYDKQFQRSNSPKTFGDRNSESTRGHHKRNSGGGHNSNKYKNSEPRFKPIYHSKPPIVDEQKAVNKENVGFSNKGGIQCKKCENFGHSAENCSATVNPFF